MKTKLLTLFSLIIGCNLTAQTAWTWTELDTTPIKITNNAVTDAIIGGEKYVFSFGGLDTTKLYSGITQRSFKYRVSNDTWTEIALLPSAATNIAAGASTVKNKIYIIGGYHVFSNGNETSSNEVIIYNPTTDLYETNGTNIPTPIDDHVQCVWKDSLIYVITGWSNTSNVPKVQIYDPELDSWTAGTDTPNTHDYKAFGTSGTIIGDTIYYFGGAKSSGGFDAVSFLRKGIINPSDPTQITWILEENGPNNGYRSACLNYGNNVYWVGGSGVSYNYNGIAYNGTGGVLPLTQIMRYKTDSKVWNAGTGAPYSVMDLRGAAQVSATSWIICGGMDENQKVTHRTFLLTYDPVTGGTVYLKKVPDFFIQNYSIMSQQQILSAKLFDNSGRVIEIIKNKTISTRKTGVYILQIKTESGLFTKQINL